jgi:hypothetical protein
MNKFIKTVVIGFFIWSLGITFFYIDELIHHPSYFSKYNFESLFDDPFNWIENIEDANKADEFTIKKGNSSSGKWIIEDDYYGTITKPHTIAKPTFNIIGYLKLLLLPLIVFIICWLLALAVNFFIWRHREDILSRIIVKLEAIDVLHKFYITTSILLAYLILFYMGCSQSAILYIIIFIFICIPIIWHLFKKALSELVYAITKSIHNAKKDNQ